MSKVWKKVTVTLTKELIVGIEEDSLTPLALDEFSKIMWDAYSAEDIFKTVGDQYVRCSEQFIEGVGKVGVGRAYPVTVQEEFEDTEVEVEEV